MGNVIEGAAEDVVEESLLLVIDRLELLVPELRAVVDVTEDGAKVEMKDVLVADSVLEDMLNEGVEVEMEDVLVADSMREDMLNKGVEVDKRDVLVADSVLEDMLNKGVEVDKRDVLAADSVLKDMLESVVDGAELEDVEFPEVLFVNGPGCRRTLAQPEGTEVNAA